MVRYNFHLWGTVLERVRVAADLADLTPAEWLRQAVVEKLDRDGHGRARDRPQDA